MKKSCFLVAFLLATLISLAQEKVSGRVTDPQNGQPLAGATVMIKGSSRGTVTDNDGRFTITAAGTDMLVISFTGYKPIEISAGSNLAKIELQAGSAQMEGATIVGSRRPGRSSLTSVSPVDVINVKEIATLTGQVDVSQLLQFAAPSFNSNRQAGSDGSDHVDAAVLRGLGADQVLVLINGKRRHSSALVNLFGSRSRGNVGTDLNSIPVNAIERIEILRDGAAAQYGSDAIAGVINIVLKDQAGKGDALVSGGIYTKGDGLNILAGANYGFNLKDNGSINLTGEFNHRGETNRAPEGNPRRIGDARLNNYNVMLNGHKPLSNKVDFYFFGGVNHRDGLAGAWYRSPTDDRNVPEIYPNGFVPDIRTSIQDYSANFGIRTKICNWNADLSNTYGYNRMEYFVEKTLNASLLAASPRNFDAGGFGFGQNTLNLNLTRSFPVRSGLNLAMGAEYRKEYYHIFAGEPGSYLKYGIVDSVDGQGNIIKVDRTGKPGGSQGFPGFKPENYVREYRTNVAGYADAELDLNKNFSISGALRFERYSDFGNTLNGKVGTRFNISPEIAIRATYSTGFRAPSLQQRYFNSTYTDFVGGVASDVVISRNDGALANALGIPSLKEETSKNFTLGFTSKIAKVINLTVDYYSIDIKDRIVLTGYFDASDPDIGGIMASQNVAYASFFANAISTNTKGVDVVASYRKRLTTGVLGLVLAANFNETKQVGAVKTSPKLAGKEDIYFGERERLFVEGSAPRTKTNLTATYDWEKFGVMVRGNYFGEVTMGTWSGGGLIQTYKPRVVLDITATLRLSDRVSWSVGGVNVLDQYPDKQNPDETESGGLYEAVQMGFNGAFFFTKLKFNL